jgi:histidyl-tRNA synthetase
MEPITAPRGTNDVFPPESAAWNELEANARDVAARFGYGEIRTPMFEATELFVRGVGETTDIVEKEMYTFLDKGGRSMTLRPEWTAPVVRAVLQHKLLARGALRLFYIGPFFRYERPQAGRYRQANQFGVECLGFEGPEADVEVMQIASALVASYGIADALLQINTIGDAVCRPAYREALLAHFAPHRDALSDDSRRRLERNPLRILDSKAVEDAPFIAAAPVFLDTLCAPCAEHFTAVRDYLDAIGLPYTINPRLVRGFDYYTRTVFEISSSALGAQSAVCGGGRYDGLFESLGGPATPAVGFGLGLERFLMVVKATRGDTHPARSGFQAIALGAAARLRLVPIVAALRRLAGAPAFMDFADRKLTTHFKTADRNGARYALIMGDDELADGHVVLRDLEARTDRRIPAAAEAEDTARALVEATGLDGR